MGVGVEEKIGPGRYVERGDHRDLTGGHQGNGGAAHETPGSDGGGIGPAAEEEEAEIFFMQGTRKETGQQVHSVGTRARVGPAGYRGWVCERRVKKVRCF
jgi:hypothetical protein